MESYKTKVNPAAIESDTEPENIEPVFLEDEPEQPKKQRKKRKKKTPEESIDLGSLGDFTSIVQLPFVTILKPPLTPEETTTLSTALMRWVDKRFNSIMEYSVDIALATALLTIVLPRTNLLKIMNAKSNSDDNREKGKRENNFNKEADILSSTQKESTNF